MIRNRVVWWVALFMVAIIHLPGTSQGANSFGVRGLSSDEDGLKVECTLLQEAGIGWYRGGLRWDKVVDDQGVFDWEALDTQVKILLKRKRNIMFTLRAVHKTFAPDSGKIDLGHKIRITSAPPSHEHVADYERFVRETVERYDGDGLDDAPFVNERRNVKHWQIENEVGKYPDTGSTFWYGSTASDYVDLYVVAYDAIKEADPEAAVALSGFNHESIEYGIDHENSFLMEVLSMLSERGGDFDIFDYHFYEDNTQAGEVVEKADHYLDQFPMFAGKPIWVTETNVDIRQMDAMYTTEEFDEFIARDIVKRFSRLLHAGVEKVFWFKLSDESDAVWDIPMAPRDFRRFRGLTENDLTLKSAYHSYKLLVSKIKGKKPGKTPASQDHVSVYKFGRKDGAVYVVWLDDPEGGEEDVSIPLPWHDTQVLITEVITRPGVTEPEMYTESTDGSGQLQITLGDAPVFVEVY